MWYKDFSDRLKVWSNLRTDIQSLPPEEALQTISDWWHQSPWQPFYLHWDDQPLWPNPWQLLSDNVYCDLARGLGILYTISMIEHKDLTSAELVLTEDGRNLVLVAKEKYILNWDSTIRVNTPLRSKIKKTLTLDQVKKQYL
jgi:hypothetical protein